MTSRTFGARCAMASLAAVMIFGGTGTAQRAAPAAPDSLTPTVQAEEIAAARGLFAPSTDGPVERPNHPPIELIPPMPFPDEAAAAERPAWTGPGGVVGRDLVTRRVMRGPERLSTALSNASGQGGGFAGADGGAGLAAGGLSETDNPATMSAPMSIISTGQRATHPWRMNVKVVMRWGASYSVCSGTMRDAETVLTAGHCVFDFGGSGWADEVWVYPGWDGVGPHFAAPDPIMNPYGWANGTALWSSTAWINGGDLNFDLGLIGVTRAVGMLTGWFGWQWGNSCAYWTSNVVNNASYPAQACPTAGLHTGRDMYYWSGFFDSCYDTNRLQLNTTPGCTNSIWGGQSGSGVYRIEGDSRWVHGITSTSDRSSYARYARQTDWWVAATDNDVIPVIRGAAFDLQALDVNAGQTSVVAGGSVGGLTHLASNPTNGAANANWGFDVYLSTNTDISTADTLLSTQNYGFSFAAMQNVTVNMVPVTIPANTPGGSYYLGVIYHNATDGNTGNNDSDGWDAVPLTVTKPDLDMTLLSGPATALPGAAINVSNTVQNIGNGAPGGFRVGLYLSNDNVCTTADTLIGSRVLGGLGVGLSSNANTPATIPNGTTLGAKFLCGIADDQSAVFESSEGNNTISAAISIVQPNLTITAVGAPAQASPGGGISVSNTVANPGTAAAGAFRVGIYLSTDATCTTGDTLLASRAVAGLANGASSAANTPATIPAATPVSTRFVCAIADDLLAVAESNESDNTGSDSIDIVSATPVVTVKVNGLHPTPPVVMTAGPANLTLSVGPTTYTGVLSWYWALIYNGTLYWVTSTGLSTTPAPFLTSAPIVLTDTPLLSLTLPPGTSMTNAFFLLDSGGTAVGSDFMTATRP